MIDHEEMMSKLTDEEKEYIENLRAQQAFLSEIQQLNWFDRKYDVKVASIVTRYEEWILKGGE